MYQVSHGNDDVVVDDDDDDGDYECYRSFVNFEVVPVKQTIYISKREEVDEDNEIHETPGNRATKKNDEEIKNVATHLKIELKMNTEEIADNEERLLL